jgi:hypothetical protein
MLLLTLNAHSKGLKMRKYRLFNKPTKVADVLQEDLNTDISSSWREKAERLRHRRWQKVHFHRPLLTRKTRRSSSWRDNFGRSLEA